MSSPVNDTFSHGIHDDNYCSLCNKKLNSLQQMKEHVRGKEHLKKLSKQGAAMQVEDGNAAVNISTGPKQSEVCNSMRQSTFEDKFDQDPVSTERNDSLDLDLAAGAACITASAACSTENMLTLKAEIATDASNDGCQSLSTVPNQKITSDSNFSGVERIDESLKMLTLYEKSVDIDSRTTEERFCDQPCQLTQTSAEEKVLNVLDKNSRTTVNMIDINIPTSAEGTVDENCELASANLPSNTAVGEYQLWCEICSKEFNSQDSAKQHFISKEHDKKKEIADMVVARTPDPASGAVIVRDQNQEWYICIVCMCRINTKDQYEKHVESPAHHTVEREGRKLQEKYNKPLASHIPQNIIGGAIAGADPVEQNFEAGSHEGKPVSQVVSNDSVSEFNGDNVRSLLSPTSSTELWDNTVKKQPVEDTWTAIMSANETSLASQIALEEISTSSTSVNEMSDETEHSAGKDLNTSNMLNVSKQKLPQEFNFQCLLCMRGMNTQKDLEIHEKGYEHLKNSATVLARDMSDEPLYFQESKEDLLKAAYKDCKTMPRHYQVELLCKIMGSHSSVLYLPTGTGKTLIAILTMQRMLTLNPRRPVLFLVDKVLLALQQACCIMKELGEPHTFHRSHLTKDDAMENRVLKVAMLCGKVSVCDGTPLWKYDVIVMTAVHHCVKRHPYKQLLKVYHLPIPQEQRPKLLGLTASPAGKETREETVSMLKQLLEDLGGANIATIDQDSSERPEMIAREQLQTYTSRTKLVILHVPKTKLEEEFQEKLLSYFSHAYLKLVEYSNRQQECSEEDFMNLDQNQTSEVNQLNEVLAELENMEPRTDLDREKFSIVHKHVTAVGRALLYSVDGMDFVLEDLERIFNDYHNPDLNKLMEMGLPCKKIEKYVKNLCDSAKLRAAEDDGERKEEALHHMSIYQKLLETLASPEYINWERPGSMALVLVREREIASKFKDHLQQAVFIQEHNMRVTRVVGHGAGSGVGKGMSVSQQNKILNDIRSHQYDIVVSTSVAEEGIDIPECQLVVCLNPPMTFKALMQVQGRARKEGSFCVVLCSSPKEQAKVENLQVQESNMTWAIAQLTQQSNS